MRIKPKKYTAKEIAAELEISRNWFHLFLQPYKAMFKAPGNMENKARKTFYTAAERELILKIWENAPYTHRCKLTN